MHDDLLAKIAANEFVKATPISKRACPLRCTGGATSWRGRNGLRQDSRIWPPHIAEPAGGALAARQARGLYALIVAPTRELANQVASHFQAVAPEGVDVVSLVGGMSIDKQPLLAQARDRRRHAGAAVGVEDGGMTPHLGRLSELRFFVLDEVDKMVEAGHFRELRDILGQVERKVTNDDGAEGFAEEEDTAAATAAAKCPAPLRRADVPVRATPAANAKEANAKAPPRRSRPRRTARWTRCCGCWSSATRSR